MKNIEEINRENVKKISAEKNYQISFLEILLKLVLELQKEREKEFNILRAFV